ncbi:hypothetical protein TNCV_47811 [Trichonephila clavipes]|nr:hypothetical protein TNCV_47811 [Trichonephila clavipes]
MCIDYRNVNQKLVKDKFPLPIIEDALATLQEAKETDFLGIWGCLRSTDSMAGEAVSLHSLLANRNGKIYRQNFEADDFPSGAVDLYKGWRANSRCFLLPLTSARKTLQPGSAFATRGHLFFALSFHSR